MKIRLGVDVVCRAVHLGSCADAVGEMLFVGHRFHTDRDGLDKLWARLPEGSQVTVVMEPTRNAWIVLAAWFRGRGAEVVLVSRGAVGGPAGLLQQARQDRPAGLTSVGTATAAAPRGPTHRKHSRSR